MHNQAPRHACAEIVRLLHNALGLGTGLVGRQFNTGPLIPHRRGDSAGGTVSTAEFEASVLEEDLFDLVIDRRIKPVVADLANRIRTVSANRKLVLLPIPPTEGFDREEIVADTDTGLTVRLTIKGDIVRVAIRYDIED